MKAMEASNLMDCMPGGNRWWLRGQLFQGIDQLKDDLESLSQDTPKPRPTEPWWAVRVEEGVFGGTSLDGVSALVVRKGSSIYGAPDSSHIYYVDHRCTEEQKVAMAIILRKQMLENCPDCDELGRLPREVRRVRIEHSQANGVQALDIPEVLHRTIVAGKRGKEPKKSTNARNSKAAMRRQGTISAVYRHLFWYGQVEDNAPRPLG